MARARSPLLLIFITIFIDLVGFGIVIPILPLYAERFGASPYTIGWLVAIYSAMQFLAAPMLGKLSDRVGRRPVLFVSLLGTAVGFFIMGIAGSLTWLFAARIIDGITGGNISTAMAYIADISAPHERSKRMGLIGAAFGLGLIFGPAIGGLLSHFSIGAPFLFAGVMALGNATAVGLWLPESLSDAHRHAARQGGSLTELFHKAKEPSLAVIMATYFFTTVAFSLLTATYPLFTHHRFGYGALQNGYIFACQGSIGAAIQGMLLGWLIRFTSDKRLAVAGTAVLTLSLLFLPGSVTPAWLFAATAGIAVGHALVAAPMNGMASKSVDAAAQGRVLGLMQSAASVARIIGPVLGGWLLNHDALRAAGDYGRTPYWVGGGVMFIASILAMAI